MAFAIPLPCVHTGEETSSFIAYLMSMMQVGKVAFSRSHAGTHGVLTPYLGM